MIVRAGIEDAVMVDFDSAINVQGIHLLVSASVRWRRGFAGIIMRRWLRSHPMSGAIWSRPLCVVVIGG